jgi:uncharacterized protein
MKAGQHSATVLYENESLLAWDSSHANPICMAPDSIAYFVQGKGQAVFSNGDLLMSDGTLNPALKGRKVTLLGLSANKALRKPDGLILDSFMLLAKTLGYHGPYVPVEKLVKIKPVSAAGAKAGAKA